jgi:NAD(P)-dependent dehydrogenase (short-subunit alcohol dehydrogenase family)
METLEGCRLAVIGGSSGVGRGIGLAAAKRGAHVAFVGRRRDLLDDAVASAGTNCLAICCDIRDPVSCEFVVGQTVAAFGGLDVLVHTAAYLPLLFIEEATAEDWRCTLETNLVAPALLTRAALPHLREARGQAIFISSDITRFPRSALGLYGASKLALDGLCNQLRMEVPEVRFTLASLGPVAPSDLMRDWDYERATEMMETWAQQGVHYVSTMDSSDVADLVMAILTTPVRVNDFLLEPPEGGPHHGVRLVDEVPPAP